MSRFASFDFFRSPDLPCDRKSIAWRDFHFLLCAFVVVLLEINFGSADYSACVVYTKTIIHLSGGESDGYLSPLR